MILDCADAMYQLWWISDIIAWLGGFAFPGGCCSEKVKSPDHTGIFTEEIVQVLTMLSMSHIIEQIQTETVCEPYNCLLIRFYSLGSHSQFWDCVINLEIKFKRRRKFSVRCLMAAVGFWVSRNSDSGIKLRGALFLQSFEKKKEFMKLLRSEACHPALD